MEYWDNARFLTLTYSDEFLPLGNSLDPSDLQLFNKRLRRVLGKRRIKFYAVGEYGEKKGRPHYHGIYFGLGRRDCDLVENVWSKGRVQLGTVTEQSINYVTAYITKKLWGDVGKNVYGERVPPFSRCSRGLGERWLNDHKIDLLADLGLRRHGKIVPMPRYFYTKLEKDIPEELKDELIRLRADEREARAEAEGITRMELAECLVKSRRQTEANLRSAREISDAKKNISLRRQ